MTMLKNKHITFSLILVCLVVVSPMAKAQSGGLLGGILGGGGGGGGGGGLLGGILGGGGGGGLLGGILGGGGGGGGLLGGILGGGGGGGLIGGILNLASIQGVLACTVNGNLPLTGTSAPPFAKAGVQLQCGRQNTVVATSTTNSAGIFAFPSNLIQMLLSTLLSDCGIVVTTPLATCNASLPLGNLVSQLTVVGSTVNGLLNVVNIAPSGFTLTTK